MSFLIQGNPLECALENNTQNTSWLYSCSGEFLTLNTVIFMYMEVGALVLLVLLTRRDDRKVPPRSWLWGHPGIAFPLNMMDGYEHRIAYCAAFASMTFDLTNLLWSPFDIFTPFSSLFSDHLTVIRAYPVLRLMVLFVQVALTTILSYPYFLALASKYRFISGLIGFVLASFRIWLLSYMASCIDESYDPLHSPVKSYFLLILVLPVILSLSALNIQYAINVINCIRRRELGYCHGDTEIVKPHHIEHVKLLLGKEKLPWHEDDLRDVSMLNPRKFWAHFGLRKIKGFMFPTRVLATFTVTIFSVYQIMVQIAFQVIYLLSLAKKFLECGYEWLPGYVYESIRPYSSTLYRYLDMAVGIWNGTLAVSGLLLVVYTYLLCLSYRRQTLKVYRGDRAIFPSGWNRRASHTLLTEASKHPGLQIAYTIWGFVIIQVFLFLLLLAVVFVIFIPPIDYQYWEIIIWIAHTVIATLVLRQLLNWTQLLLTWIFFLQDKTNETDQHRPLAIDNRKSWYNMSFFFFFWNLFLGVISALLRVLRGIVFGIFFIPRIDRPVLMKGFEGFDAGFIAYLSLLSVMNAHDHPVLKVFIKVLMDGVKKTARNGDLELVEANNITTHDNESYIYDSQHNEVHQKKQKRNSEAGTKRAKYYWFLAYTLICNPELLSYRKVEVDDSDEQQPGCQLKKHKIVLAMHRKQKGQKTSELYS